MKFDKGFKTVNGKRGRATFWRIRKQLPHYASCFKTVNGKRGRATIEIQQCSFRYSHNSFKTVNGKRGRATAHPKNSVPTRRKSAFWKVFWKRSKNSRVLKKSYQIGSFLENVLDKWRRRVAPNHFPFSKSSNVGFIPHFLTKRNSGLKFLSTSANIITFWA